MKKVLIFSLLVFLVSFILTAYQVGDTVKDLIWFENDGNLTISRSLHDLTGMNKIIMIAFGDEWCDDSRSVIPYLQQISETIDNEQFILIYDFSNNSRLNTYYWRFSDRNIPYFIMIDSDNTLRYSSSIKPSIAFIKNLIEGMNSSVPVYRFFNTVTGGHLYTLSEIERDYILEHLHEWANEGISFKVYLEETSGTVPSYRFFNTNTGIHLYTISEHERVHIIDNLPEWNYEGVSFYVYPSLTEGTIPVFRFFNTLLGGHLYTISEHERDYIIDNLPEWNYEGISFYVYPYEEVVYAPLPRTGQTVSLRVGDDGYYQMGVPWPEPRFTDHDDGTVTDNLTGLMWTKSATLANHAFDWYDAIDFCNNLYHGGYTDWRLPNAREIHSLIDKGEDSADNPALPENHPFTDVQSPWYWSSSTYAGDTDYAWGLNINRGDLRDYTKTDSFYVWAVRCVSDGIAPVPRTGQSISYREGDDGDLQMGVPWPEPRFTDNGDGTVRDNLTGLMWSKEASMMMGPVWKDAVTFCYNLHHAGYADWRLPNARELFSLINLAEHSPALPNNHPFTGHLDWHYWSSTFFAPYDVNRWYVTIIHGELSFLHRDYPLHAWPVRGGN